MTTLKRIKAEWTKYEKCMGPDDGFTMSVTYKDADTNEIDYYNWTGTIIGPMDTPFENGIIDLTIQFTEKYPFSPPVINFVTKIYHPNVSKHGEICIDILKSSGWSSALSMPKILMSLSSLLAAPNPDDPLRSDAATDYKTDMENYNKKVKESISNFKK